MFHILATSAPAADGAGGELTLLGVLACVLTIVFLWWLLSTVLGGPTVAPRPPEFRPVQPQPPELVPTENVPPPNAPVTVDIEIDRARVVRQNREATPRWPVN